MILSPGLIMEMKQNPYKKLGISLLLSFTVMYCVMYLNVEDASHIYVNLNRVYMALLMVSPMAIIMIGLMKDMYPNGRLNNIIMVLSALVFGLSLACLRTQAFVSDAQYMEGMIPHHSSAIMTSRNAALKDPRVKQLADSIIKSQNEEIDLMKSLIRDKEK